MEGAQKVSVAAFLAARLDEDEAAAKLAAREGGTWTQDDPERYPRSISSLGGQVVYDEGSPDEYQGAHIARHDPARALREVAAGRAILAEHAAAGWMAYGDHMCRRCVYDDDEPHDELHHWVAFPCPTLRQLAVIWDDHPDYRQEWKP